METLPIGKGLVTWPRRPVANQAFIIASGRQSGYALIKNVEISHA